jgi:hypothetical protein
MGFIKLVSEDYLSVSDANFVFYQKFPKSTAVNQLNVPAALFSRFSCCFREI